MGEVTQVTYVGVDEGRLAQLHALLAAGDLTLAGAVAGPAAARAAAHDAPDVAVLDAVDAEGERAVADVALLGLTWPQAAVVVLHDDSDPAVVRSLLDAGATSIVPTSMPPEQLRATLAAAGDGHGLIDVGVVRPVIDLYATMHADSRRRSRAVIESLAAAVEAKDSVTSAHLRAVGRLAVGLADRVAPALAVGDDFLFGCLLHDVGKIGVPEHILSKPGPLTGDEWEVMRRHPETGVTVVRPLGLSPVVTDVVLHHHERWDGGGYPHGLAGEDIPLPARIFSVCDALEAMTAERPYRPPVTAEVAFERVRLEAGQQFDPAVVDALEAGVATGELDLGATTGLPARRRISAPLAL